MSSSHYIRCPELLAPAGNITCLQAALDAGADSIYIGLDRFNMRWEAAQNFTLADLPEASRRCRARGVRLYLTLNCIVFESELAELAPLVAAVQPHIDAAIVSDWAVIELCRQHDIPCHISTQMSVSNSAAARRLKDLGAKRIVLARECTLAEVAAIRRAVDVELEAFVHGAMCVAISGRCLLSHEAFGLSCNRGECRQPCRREYLIQELDGENAAFVVGRNYVLSPRDLCSLPFLDELIAAGLDAFKIEGRSRNPEYVHTVVGAYRAALDAWQQGRLDAVLKADLTARCRSVFNREFSTGLYFGRPAVGDFTPDEGNRATHRKAYVGRVIHYYAQAGMAQIDVLDEAVVTGDLLSIQGPTTGVVDVPATLLRRDETVLTEAARGWFTVACPHVVRRGDQVYVLRPFEAGSLTTTPATLIQNHRWISSVQPRVMLPEPPASIAPRFP